jgi:hypothetical protein
MDDTQFDALLEASSLGTPHVQAAAAALNDAERALLRRLLAAHARGIRLCETPFPGGEKSRPERRDEEAANTRGHRGPMTDEQIVARYVADLLE